ncbi:unnamed protein product [Auanema sp. JU1783]|nr:unnamed protein product [Auanema sp. JU1783]
MNSFHFCCVCPQSPSATKEYQQFFESINTSSTSNSDEESLQAFLIEKSLKIQPKEFKTLDMNMKTRRPPQLTRSPCFRTPKSNVYTTLASTSQQQGSTAAGSPNPDADGSKLAYSCPKKENNQMTVDSQHIRHYQEVSNLQKPPQLPPKIGLLQPPFPYPRKTSPKSSPPLMPSAVASLGFISKYESPLPLKTSPIPGSSNPVTAESDTLIFSSPETSVTPTSIPPALPPRRRTNPNMSPPPLPPKPNRNSSASPPPLPPKTYKQKQCSPEPRQEK